MKNIPKEIYLQIGGLDPDVFDQDFNDLAEVTWCKDRIGDHDVKYISAGRVSELLAEVARNVRHKAIGILLEHYPLGLDQVCQSIKSIQNIRIEEVCPLVNQPQMTKTSPWEEYSLHVITIKLKHEHDILVTVKGDFEGIEGSVSVSVTVGNTESVICFQGSSVHEIKSKLIKYLDENMVIPKP